MLSSLHQGNHRPCTTLSCAAAGEEHPAGGWQDDAGLTLLQGRRQQHPRADGGRTGHHGGCAGETTSGLLSGWAGPALRMCFVTHNPGSQALRTLCGCAGPRHSVGSILSWGFLCPLAPFSSTSGSLRFGQLSMTLLGTHCQQWTNETEAPGIVSQVPSPRCTLGLEG